MVWSDCSSTGPGKSIQNSNLEASMQSNLNWLGFLLVFSAGATAGATTINFEQYADGTQIIHQYTGVTFSNALELTDKPITGTLNSVVFPPHAGIGVITDQSPVGTPDPLFGKPTDPNAILGILFSSPQTGASFYYAAQSNLTVSIYNSSNVLIDQLTAPGGLTFPGGKPTGKSVLFSVSGLPAFSNILVSDKSGIQEGFVLDDLTFGTTTPPPSVVPEPGSWMLLGSGLVMMAEMVRRRQSV
jgi:PEP-CTERM motif